MNGKKMLAAKYHETRATGNSRFEGDKFPVLFLKNPENSRLELMTYLLANTFIFDRKWPRLTHFINCTKLNSHSL